MRIDRLPLLLTLAAVVTFAAGCGKLKEYTPMGYFQKNNIRAAKVTINMLGDAVNHYRLDVGDYPETLQALVENSDDSEKWAGPYLRTSIPKDPWGRDYLYNKPGENERDYDIICCGPDGKLGTADDITSFDDTDI